MKLPAVGCPLIITTVHTNSPLRDPILKKLDLLHTLHHTNIRSRLTVTSNSPFKYSCENYLCIYYPSHACIESDITTFVLLITLILLGEVVITQFLQHLLT